MKVISIRQPWIFAILHCSKRIENRNWPASHRGPVLLHASKGMTLNEYTDFYNMVMSGRAPYAMDVLKGLDALNLREMPGPETLPRGGIAGRARIVDCVTSSPSPWFCGPYGFVLEDVEPLAFIPMKGKLGLFDADVADLPLNSFKKRSDW
jgi:hypothetical protein